MSIISLAEQVLDVCSALTIATDFYLANEGFPADIPAASQLCSCRIGGVASEDDPIRLETRIVGLTLYGQSTVPCAEQVAFYEGSGSGKTYCAPDAAGSRLILADQNLEDDLRVTSLSEVRIQFTRQIAAAGRTGRFLIHFKGIRVMFAN